MPAIIRIPDLNLSPDKNGSPKVKSNDPCEFTWFAVPFWDPVAKDLRFENKLSGES